MATLSFMMNFSSSVIILPQYLLTIGGNEFLSGLQATIYFLAAVILRMYLGPMADSHGRKLPLLISGIAFATAPLLFAISYDFTTLTLARVYHAIGLAAFFSSGSSFVSDIAPPAKLGVYLGVYRTVHSFGLLLGPALGYWIINQWGYTTWFLASFAIGLIGVFFISILTARPAQRSQELHSLQWMKTVLKQPNTYPVYLGIAILSTGYGALLTFAAIYISSVTQLQNPGVFFTYFALAGIVANLSVGKLSDRFGRLIVVWPCMILFGLGFLAFFTLPYAPVSLFISSMFAGFGFSGGLLVLIAWLVDLVKEELRATALSIQESTIDVSVASGSLIFGITGSYLGLSFSMLLFGIFVIAASIPLYANRTFQFQRLNQ
ncbi:hypothetical protein BHU72_04310 [Desulfuribacillus stibiiarsenatis]|uniref:Major facilitator superfamily (MFS) profile domain-containing protein n=2 Tax=Desulfuribacillus stibiiarsenatis TaxID=1390249 RepID=A0A1E5L5B4_9FIRM|nr:hypothetical protein BHU72_04310 [Desulfuribacillus stibiiarsenatis]